MASTDQQMSPDIDKGWAFIIAIFGFVIQMFTVGLSFSSSIFYATFLDEFQGSPVTTAWALNLNTFCIAVGGIIANCFLIMIGPRLTFLLACSISSAGLVASSFVTSPIGILGTYGFLTGIGFGFAYFVTFSQIPNYFRKYRIIVNAVVATGAGMGQFVNPPLLRFLFEKYHWRGAFIVLAGINLNTLVLAAATIPPRHENVSLEGKSSSESGLRSNFKKALNTVKTVFSGISIFKNPFMCSFCVANTLLTLAQGGFVTHIFNFARSPRFGFGTTQVTFLPSVVGIGSVSGQLIIGAITQAPKVHVILMFIICCGLLIIGSVIISLVDSYGIFVFCCISSGISFATDVIYFEAVVHILGLERFNFGLSYNLIFAGIGYLLGGPFAAWIYELDPSYLWSFRVIGICAFAVVVLIFPAWLTIKDRKIQQRKAKDDLRRESDFIAEKLDTHAQDFISHL